jgi:O-antigen/teichoic acid export membrane protein
VGRQVSAPPSSAARLLARAVPVVGNRLVRTAWPLMLNTGANGALGIAYWVIAARLYDQATVATNMAVVAAMTTLSGLAQLNLGPSLAVLVPRAGAGARRVLLRVYGVVTGYGVVALTVFALVVLPHLNELSAALGSPTRLLVFGAAVLLFNLFALQDAALISLRRTGIVPVENTVFGIAKIAALFVLVEASPGFGIFASWVLPMIVLVPVVSGYVFRQRPPAATSALPPATSRESVPQLALDYVGYLFQVASTFFLPVIALELLSPGAAAVFGIAWLTSSTLDLLATNVGTALTVETSYGEDPRRLRRTILRAVIPLLASVTAAGLLLAPLILGLYGSHYSAEGVDVLRVLLLASLPRCLVTFAIAECRAHRQMGTIVYLRAQNAVVALGLSFALAPHLGAKGMALAWLAAQILGAMSAIRLVWRKPVSGTETAECRK